jgi:regulator of RNase E activity RraB
MSNNLIPEWLTKKEEELKDMSIDELLSTLSGELDDTLTFIKHVLGTPAFEKLETQALDAFKTKEIRYSKYFGEFSDELCALSKQVKTLADQAHKFGFR